jgi:integrase
VARRLPEGIRERTLPGGAKRYDVRVEFPPDPRTGRRRSPSRTFAALEDAKAYQRKALTELDEGIVIAPDRLTVEGLLHRWVEQEARHRVRPSTLEGYQATIATHIVTALGTRRVQSLTPADVAAFRSHLLSATGVRSTQLALLRLSQALAWGVSVELLKRNVAAGIKPPRSTTPEKRALTHAETRAFLEIAATDHYAPLWRVYLATGLRRGEALGLRWKDLDLKAHTLSVRQQVVLSGKPAQPTIQEPKSVAARRTLELDPLTLTELTVHKERQAQLKANARLWQPLDLIFATRNGFPLNPNNVLRNFARLREDAGLEPGFTLHDLRHTHISHLILAGVPLLEVSRRAGHSKTSITIDTYSHLLADYRGSSVDAVAAALDGGLSALDG